jgi:hypothetical protein
MGKPKYRGARASAENIIVTNKHVARAISKTWQIADKSRMMLKKPADGKAYAEGETKRTLRMISSPAWKVAASGAAARVASTLGKESSVLRSAVAPGIKSNDKNELVLELPMTPWVPSLSKGAQMALEHFLCAFTQEAARNALSIRKLANKRRLDVSMINAGFDAATESIFGGASPAPRVTFVQSAVKKAKSSKSDKHEPAKAAKAAKSKRAN